MKQWIICKWKPTGAYTANDALMGKLYKHEKTAERILKQNGHLADTHVVRSI
jgi:hypothetical protein